jgi:hypothetical protein
MKVKDIDYGINISVRLNSRLRYWITPMRIFHMRCFAKKKQIILTLGAKEL